MVNWNAREEALAPWRDLYNEVKSWLSEGPSSAMTFDDGDDLISLTWIHERVGNETWLGIRVNHAQVDYIGMMIEEAHVRFISIINLENDGTPLFFIPKFDSEGLPFLEQLDSIRMLETYRFTKEQENDRWVYFK